MSGTHAVLVIALAALAPLAAQDTAVWPTGYERFPGGAMQAAPFSVSGRHRQPTGRSVTAIAASSLPFRAGSAITGLAFRRDAVSPEAYGATSGELVVYIGEIRDAARPIGALGALWRTGPQFVRKGRIDLPAAAPPAVGSVASFDLQVPFHAPWTYPGGDLAIDLLFEGQPGTRWRRGAVEPDGSAPAHTEPLGAGCRGSNGLVPRAFADTNAAIPGGLLDLMLEGASLDRSGATANLLGIALPQSLPLSNLGFPPGCALHVAPLDTAFAGTGDRSVRFARSRRRLPIPSIPSLSGVELATQWTVLDSGLPASLPMTMSDAVLVTIGSSGRGRYLGRSLWLYGQSLGGDQGAEISPRNYVPVTRFSGSLVR